VAEWRHICGGSIIATQVHGTISDTLPDFFKDKFCGLQQYFVKYTVALKREQGKKEKYFLVKSTF
jgi:hypothetical protein